MNIGKEQNVPHDFILITMADGQQFVLDLTGDQFGFRTWFYSKSDYYSNYIVESEDVDVRSAQRGFEDACKRRIGHAIFAVQTMGWLKIESLEELKGAEYDPEWEKCSSP